MPASAVEVIPANEIAPAPVAPGHIGTPMALLTIAVERGSSIETIERLSALAERVEAQRARREFDEAISSFKAEAPRIVKDREIKHGEKLISRYEDMAAISKAIDPVLAKHGLSYRFRTEALEKAAKVTCIISHRSGHSEETSLSGPHDNSGSKNAIQGLGSSVTYLQRYTLKAALGLAVSNDDDCKAHGGAGDTIGEEEAESLAIKIESAGSTIKRVCAAYKIETLADLPKSRLADCERRLLATARENGKSS